MGRFKQITQKIQLKFIGDDWKDCYFEFEPVTVREVKEMGELEQNTEAALKTIELLKKKFVKGTALDKEGKETDVKVEELEDFPLYIIEEVMHFLSKNHLRDN